jgi:hypothetical protein
MRRGLTSGFCGGHQSRFLRYYPKVIANDTADSTIGWIGSRIRSLDIRHKI